MTAYIMSTSDRLGHLGQWDILFLESFCPLYRTAKFNQQKLYRQLSLPEEDWSIQSKCRQD